MNSLWIDAQGQSFNLFQHPVPGICYFVIENRKAGTEVKANKKGSHFGSPYKLARMSSTAGVGCGGGLRAAGAGGW
jgi:hypothetical protein